MPYCNECQADLEVVARCAGDNCRAGICPLCFEGDGLCSECRTEQAKGIWEPSCRRTGEPAADCICTEVDDAHIDC